MRWALLGLLLLLAGTARAQERPAAQASAHLSGDRSAQDTPAPAPAAPTATLGEAAPPDTAPAPSAAGGAPLGGALLGEAPEARLARGYQAYLRNDFAATVALVRGLLYPDIELRSYDDVQTAHRLLALAYLFLRDDQAAEHEFTALLQLKPDFALDPIVDPPQAIAFLEKLRARERQRLEALEQRRRAEDERRRQQDEARRHAEEEERIRQASKLIEKHWFALNFVPFGAGQFQNGQRAKGWAVFGSQLALGATSLALWTALQVEYDRGKRRVPQAEAHRAVAMSLASVTTGAIFWADVLWGIVDALIYYRPQVVRPAFPPPAARVSVRPYSTSSGGGLSLQGSF